MKTYNEMADEVFCTGDRIIEARKKKKKKYVAVISSAAVITVSTLVLWQSGIFNKSTPISTQEESTAVSRLTTDTSTTQPTKKDIYEPVKSVVNGNSGSDKSASESSKDETYGDDTGYFCIPVFPTKDGIKYSGEKITDEEAKNYFGENTWIVSALTESGVETDRIKISETGYCHTSFTGQENEQLFVKLNFRDYPVFNGDSLIAIITLVKENGKISATPSFGATWFEKYSFFLNAHKGEKLVMAYAGAGEFIVTPDGEITDFYGGNLKKEYGNVANIYEKLYCPESVYVP